MGLEALHQLMDKDAVEPVQISGLLQPTFLVPKPDSRWRPSRSEQTNLSETISGLPQ